MIYNLDLLGYINKLIFIIRIRINIFLFNYLAHIYCFIKGVHINKNVKFNGFPKIYREPYSRINIGANCKFNSSRNSVRIGLNKRCTFVTLNKGAEISIGNNSGATGVTIAAYRSIKIGENVLIGAYCTIIDNDFHNPNPYKRDIYSIPSKSVVIENNVFLGMNCTVLKGVTIGRNSIIGANSVIVSNIPPNSLAMGNPCKLVVKRNWENSSDN